MASTDEGYIYSSSLPKDKISPIKSDNGFGMKATKRGMSATHGNFMNSPSVGSRIAVNKSLGMEQLSHLQIFHEIKKFGDAPSTSTENSTVGRRNPILQLSNERTEVFKPVCKRIPGCGETTMFTVKEKPRNTKPGEFHPRIAQPRQERVQSIRTVQPIHSKSHSEVQRRQLKSVNIPKTSFNPITEGDPASVKVIKIRKFDQEISQSYAKHNEKKFLLPADRKLSPKQLNNGPSPTKARVNLDENLHIMSSTASSFSSSFTEKPHPMVLKHRGTISDILQYKNGPRFKDNGVSDKVNRVPAKVVTINLNAEKHFAKKKVQYIQNRLRQGLCFKYLGYIQVQEFVKKSKFL